MKCPRSASQGTPRRRASSSADATGSFAGTIRWSRAIAISTSPPATAKNIVLEATLENGRRVTGETRISRSRSPIARIRLRPGKCLPLPDTLEAIAGADLITFGPGSLFTSVIPNLLVEGVAKAIRRSQAIKAYFVNLMWQPGETTGFRASDHIAAIHRHAGGKLIDYAVLNTRAIKLALRKRYARELSQPVENDMDAITAMRVDVVCGDLVQQSGKVRHNQGEREP